MKNEVCGMAALSEKLATRLLEAEPNMRKLFELIYRHNNEVNCTYFAMFNFPYIESEEKSGFAWNNDLPLRVQKAIDEGKVTQAAFVDGAKDILKGIFGNEPLCVGQVREISRFYLRSFRTSSNRQITIGQDTYDWLGDETIDLMATLATAVYLEGWLSQDKGSRQSIHNFSSEPYIPSGRKNNGQYAEADEASRRQMYRAYDKFVEFHKLREWQLSNETAKVSMLPYRQKGDGRELDIITLSWCEAWSEGALELLDYLFRKKSIMHRAEDERSNTYKGLATVCQRYRDYIEMICKLDTSNEVNARRFVASSMMLHRLERAYRFAMNAEVAHRVCRDKIKLADYQGEIEQTFLGRIAFNGDSWFAPKWTRLHSLGAQQTKESAKVFDCTINFDKGRTSKPNKQYTYIDEAYDVLEYSYYIDNIFPETHEKSTVESILHSHRRLLIRDLILFLFSMYPPKKQRPWTATDFSDATFFYRSEYPIAPTLATTVFPSITGKLSSNEYEESDYAKYFYSVFRRCYVVQDYEGSYLQVGRKMIETNKRRR